ncbi:MAG: hypothetical protein U5S82_02480 [Gammaproteobacteria bacterium]|nr:hypothetical protein [Gammaproteobacteria bacterium]
MSDLKCPFSVVLAAASAHCRHAREVVRRGGVEYDCTVPGAHAVCHELAEHLKARALPALGHEDDLTVTPKSVYERILLGGVQGLGAAGDGLDPADATADIWTTVDAARRRHGAVAAIPDDAFIPAIEACTLRKRRRRT